MDSTRKYLLEQLVNLNNRDSFDSFTISRRIEGFRSLLKERYSWDGEILFFPNPYYAKRTIFENFRELPFFTDRPPTSSMHGFQFKSPSLIEPHTPHLFFTKGKPKNAKDPNSYVLVELEWREVDPGEADAFVSSPISGLAILGYRGSLKPIYLGSNAVEYLDRSGYSIVENSPKAFECGTGNYPLILFLMDLLGHCN